ncbi:hypothetical protein COL922a_008845 [Colletotrichum nupharicola]|nr:hypothetical protein COL922a_008845 [Colletotrichum nupharicola]
MRILRWARAVWLPRSIACWLPRLLEAFAQVRAVEVADDVIVLIEYVAYVVHLQSIAHALDGLWRRRRRWNRVVLCYITNDFAVLAEDLASHRNRPSDHRRQVTLDTTKNLSVPVEDVSELIDILSIQSMRQLSKV